jgi:hypothetical protein
MTLSRGAVACLVLTLAAGARAEPVRTLAFGASAVALPVPETFVELERTPTKLRLGDAHGALIATIGRHQDAIDARLLHASVAKARKQGLRVVSASLVDVGGRAATKILLDTGSDTRSLNYYYSIDRDSAAHLTYAFDRARFEAVHLDLERMIEGGAERRAR